MAMRTIGVKLRMDTSEYVKDTGKATEATEKLSAGIGKTGQKAKANWDEIAKGAGIAGLALVGLAGAAVATAMSFDKQMSEVGAVADATAGQLDDLRQAALKAGKDTSFSATEAAKAEAELAKAGLSSSQILGGALTGALSLAAAGSLDLAEAADVAAKAMNVFQLEGSDVGHIADVLAAAANKSATDVHELGEAMKMGGEAAHQAGLSLEDTVGTLALFADHALSGSDAGTSFKTMLVALAAPSDKAADLMKELGINVYDAQGQFVGIEKLAGILQDRLGDLTQEQRNSALATIFGTDAMRAAAVLYESGDEGVRKYTDAVNDQGAAAEVAAKKTDNLAGDLERLKGSLETLAIQSGSGASGGLRVLVQMLDGLIGKVTELPSAVTSTAVVLAGLGGAALLAMAGFLKARSTVSDFMETLANIGPRGEKAATLLGRIGSIAGKAGLWGAGLLIAYEGVSSLIDYLSKKAAPTARDVDKLSSSLQTLASSGRATGELSKIYGEQLQGIGKDLDSLLNAQAKINELKSGIAGGKIGIGGKGQGNNEDPRIGELTRELAQAKVNIEAVDTALAGITSSGHAAQASAAFNEITQALLDSGYSLDEINAKFPQYAAAASGAAAANKPLVGGLGELKTATGDVSIGIQEAIDKGLALKDVLNSLTGANTDSAKAQMTLEQSLDDLTAGFKRGHDALDITNQKGRDNLGLILTTTDALKSEYEATYDKIAASGDEAGALAKSQKEYDKYIGKLQSALHKLGLTDDQIASLIDKYAAIPPQKTTTVTVKINYVESGFGNSAYAQYFSGGRVQVNRWGGITEHAATGLLRDPAIYDAVTSGARYAFAEPATGGEAFVPKRGDYGRSMGILSQAAGWYGADVVPRGAWYGGSGSATQVEHVYRIPLEGTGLFREFQRVITARGGSVQVEMGPAPRRP